MLKGKPHAKENSKITENNGNNNSQNNTKSLLLHKITRLAVSSIWSRHLVNIDKL